jgi:hypothetical protein
VTRYGTGYCIGAVAGDGITVASARRLGSDVLQRRIMVLSTHKVEDFERWLRVFSTKGAEKRKQHGSKGSHVFRDPNDDRRVWVVFDWDEDGFRSFASDPETAAIFEEGGIQGRPQVAEFVHEHDA